MKKTIAEISLEFDLTEESRMDDLCHTYKDDARVGVQNLIKKAIKKQNELRTERERIKKLEIYERKYEHLGYVCGIDEVGRGPLAGPVVAGAVILPKDCQILYLNDSNSHCFLDMYLT